MLSIAQLPKFCAKVQPFLHTRKLFVQFFAGQAKKEH